jgi:hypothetical protein
MDNSLHPRLRSCLFLDPPSRHRDCRVCQQSYYHQTVLRQQMEYQRQQAEYQKKKDEYYLNLVAQNQALLSVSRSNILFVTTKNT